MTDHPAYLVIEEELACLRGLGLLAIALYVACLKGHTDADGWVFGSTLTKITESLAPRDSRAGGHRLPRPTVHQVRGAIDRLQIAGLLVVDHQAARDTRQMRVRLRYPGNVKT